MKYLITLLLLTGGLLLTAQKEVQKPKQNQIEIFYNVSEFFDGSPTNWLFLQRFDEEDGGNELRLPATFGVQYAHRINARSHFQLSASVYDKYYNYDADRPLKNQVMQRSMYRFSVRYLREIWGNKKGRISLLGGLNYRLGFEDYYPLGGPVPAWGLVGTETLNDFGISAGVRLVKPVFGDFFLSLEASYTRYLFFGKGDTFDSGSPKSSPQNLTLRYGLGYRF
ncbi:MAG: hypothetical protein RI565_07605 [Schleiferiaceae bacterium]|nr:hypothetical protein [Schleiferiaceae bacterium]